MKLDVILRKANFENQLKGVGEVYKKISPRNLSLLYDTEDWDKKRKEAVCDIIKTGCVSALLRDRLNNRKKLFSNLKFTTTGKTDAEPFSKMWLNTTYGIGSPEWGANLGERYFIIKFKK